MSQSVVLYEELTRRTIRREQFVSCNQAFIDCRTPGSDRKENYAMIGPGVSQNPDQVVNLRDPHGFNIGAAAMPNGVTNNLHLHFTAEVFICFRGEFLLRWGVDGDEGELLLREGDIASIPTWIFRGFTNVGPDDGWLFTVLGHDETGGIIWGPSVLREAAEHGLYLSADNQLVDTAAGQTADEGGLIQPMPEAEIAKLRRFSVEQLRRRIAAWPELDWSTAPFLDSAVEGGGAHLAQVVGYGMTEDRNQEPRVHYPHGHTISWLRAEPGQGMLLHRHTETQVLIAKDGAWEVTLNAEQDQTVRLEPWDMVSVPRGAWRSVRAVGPEASTLLIVNGGDSRVRLEWSDQVVKAAAEGGVGRDASGYTAPAALLGPSPVQ